MQRGGSKCAVVEALKHWLNSLIVTCLKLCKFSIREVDGSPCFCYRGMEVDLAG